MPDLAPGANFAGHRIEGVAGRGGMGVVYRATHLALDHVVALKVISPELAADAVFRKRFVAESRAAVSIRHPNVVPIHHAGEEEGLLFVTMDLIEGMDLRRLLDERGSLTAEHAVDLLGQVAQALDAAHERGLVHRDIKPGNILIEARRDGEHVYLTDFGLTKRIGSASGVTATDAFVGTLDYVAPEQIRGEELDARADVYALGCVLYEMLSGATPFEARSENVAKIYAHLQDPPPSLAEGDAGLPVALNAVVARAMDKDPAERFPSAGDMGRAAAAGAAGLVAPADTGSVATGLAAPGVAAGAAATGAGAGGLAPTIESLAPQSSSSAAENPTIVAPTRQPTIPVQPEQPEQPTTEAPTPEPARRAQAEQPTTEARSPEPAVRSSAGADAELPDLRATEPALGRDSSPDAGALASDAAAPSPSRSFGDGAAASPSSRLRGPGAAAGSASRGSSGDGVRARRKVSKGLLGAGAGAAVAVVVVVGLLISGSGDGGDGGQSAGGSGATDRAPIAGDPISIDGTPVGVAAGGGSVWVGSRLGNELFELNADGERVGSSTPLGIDDAPEQVALGDGSVWVALTGAGEVARIDRSAPAAGEPERISVGTGPRGVTFAQGRVWVTNEASNNVSVIDPALPDSGGESIEVGNGPHGIAFGAGAVWVTNRDDDTVSRIDPEETASPLGAAIEVGQNPKGIAISDGTVWVANTEDGTVTPIDSGTEVPGDTIVVEGEPRGVIAAFGSVWVANGAGYVTQINPETMEVVVPEIDIPAPVESVPGAELPSPEEIAADGERLWVTTGDGQSVVPIDPAP